MPSLSNSPWIRGAPQSGLARLMSRINLRMSADSFGRPPGDLGFHRQERRKTARRHAITVSGLTIAKALSTFGAKPYNPANISRSNLLNVDRFGDLRRRTFGWWSTSKSSACTEARGGKNPTSAHQISLQNSTIRRTIHPIRRLQPTGLGFRQGQPRPRGNASVSWRAIHSAVGFERKTIDHGSLAKFGRAIDAATRSIDVGGRHFPPQAGSST